MDHAMTETLYKFLDEKGGALRSRHGDQTWKVGETYSLPADVEPELCSRGFHASRTPLDALGYVKGNIIAAVEVSGLSDIGGDKEAWQSMTITAAYRWTRHDSVALAVYAAELVLHLFEARHPDDNRPRKAIEAAKAYLRGESYASASDAAYAAADAASAAYAASDAAYGAAYAAAYAASDAAYGAAYAAAYAAYAAAYASDADAAYAASDAAYAAYGYAASAGIKQQINAWIIARLSTLAPVGNPAVTS